MPTFEVETDTDIYDVEAATAEDARAIVEAQLGGSSGPPPPPTEPPKPDGGAIENAATFAGAQTNALPVVGPYIESGVNHLAAWGAQGLNALGLAPENSPAATMNHAQLMDLAARNKARLEEENPNFAAGGKVSGQIAGSIIAAEAAPALFGQAAGQGMAAQIGLGMAGNAGLTAADVASRGGSAEDVASEAGISAVAGGAAPIISRAVRGGLDFLGNVRHFRPSRIADRRIAEGIQADIRAGKAMPTEEFDRLRAEGAPVRNLDRFGNAVLNEAGWAAKNSGAVADQVDDTIGARHLGQSERVVSKLEDMVGGPVNRTQVKENIRETGRLANKPVYDRAEAMPSAQSMWTDELQRLSSNPDIARAIDEAEEFGARVATIEGGKPIVNPFVRNADGTLSMKPGVTPNLRFWDIVKRKLGSIEETTYRNVGKTEGNLVKSARQSLTKELDAIVPEYKQARGTAAEFFKAEDAVEAGENLINGNYSNMEEVARNAMKFNSAEREGLKVGAAGALIEKLEKITDTGELTNALRNPAMRKKLTVAFGQEGADEIEAMVATEVLFSAAKRATSTRGGYNQVIGMGVGAAGGMAGGYSLSQGDPWSAAKYAAVGAVAGAARKKLMLNVADEIGAKLISDDPNAIKEAMKIAERSPQTRELMMNMSVALRKAIAGSGTTLGDQFNQ